MLFVAIVVYAVAMIVANLTVAAFGPAVTPINAFFLVGLDLTLRDWLPHPFAGVADGRADCFDRRVDLFAKPGYGNNCGGQHVRV